MVFWVYTWIVSHLNYDIPLDDDSELIEGELLQLQGYPSFRVFLTSEKKEVIDMFEIIQIIVGSLVGLFLLFTLWVALDMVINNDKY